MQFGHRLWRSDRAAVAPIVALSMFGLIACGGIAFDYARLATMDTELQQAADQAALAAAGQLDHIEADASSGELGAQARARAAISGTAANRLAANTTRFSNVNNGDGSGVEFTVANINFCKAYDDSKPNATACTAATDDTDARYVIVTTTARTANYLLTPIVAAFSGTSSATAVAGVESSICNIAPLFVCTDDENFPGDADIGRGLLMKTGSGNSWAPGNYGLLDFGAGNNGAINALLGHGLNGCLATSDVQTQPGNKEVTDAINTRMDVYDGSPLTKDPTACNVADGTGCPSSNSRKDVVIDVTPKNNAQPKIDTFNTTVPPTQAQGDAVAASCPADPKGGGYEFVLPQGSPVGFNRDDCHYSGTCADGNFGDKNWDRAGYLAANHPGVTAASIATALNNGTTGATLTRYDIYQWEMASPSTRMSTRRLVSFDPPSVSGPQTNRKRSYGVRTQCSYPGVKYGSTAYPAQKDRRILPIVAANCAALNGKASLDEKFRLLRVFDAFLTEPSEQRALPGVTDNKEIYGEVIGPAKAFEAGAGLQYYSRNRPYLIR